MLVAIIVIVVAGISIYEYYSSKSWQQVTSSERNEIVFQDRNQLYGAYQIRKNYSKLLIIILLSVTAFIGIAFGVHKIIANLPKEQVVETPLDLTTFALDAPDKDEEIIEPLEPEIPPMEKTIQFLPPVVTDDEVTTPPPTTEELQDTKASDVTNTQETDPFAKNEPAPPKKEEKIEKKEPVIYDIVDEQAEFPGGRAALMKYLGENIRYPQVAQEMGIQGKCYLSFIVSESGFISNVSVKKGVTDCPECDAEAVRVVKAMPKWTPGKVNGKTVNQKYSLPVTFKLN
jgi:protein TonB